MGISNDGISNHTWQHDEVGKWEREGRCIEETMCLPESPKDKRMIQSHITMSLTDLHYYYILALSYYLIPKLSSNFVLFLLLSSNHPSLSPSIIHTAWNTLPRFFNSFEISSLSQYKSSGESLINIFSHFSYLCCNLLREDLIFMIFIWPLRNVHMCRF